MQAKNIVRRVLKKLKPPDPTGWTVESCDEPAVIPLDNWACAIRSMGQHFCEMASSEVVLMLTFSSHAAVSQLISAGWAICEGWLVNRGNELSRNTYAAIKLVSRRRYCFCRGAATQLPNELRRYAM